MFKYKFKLPLRNKYGAIKCEEDGKKFPSKLERDFYRSLKKQQEAGAVLFFLRQVPFDLPGNVIYRCDFQIFYTDGNISFVDTKGRDTPMSILKRKQVEDIYPVTIDIVKRF